jgi:hypothetical protein
LLVVRDEWGVFANSTDRFRHRARKIHSSLEFIIENAERWIPSRDALIRAVRAYTSINDDGKSSLPPNRSPHRTSATALRARRRRIGGHRCRPTENLAENSQIPANPQK